MKTIVVHIGPDLDALTSIWLIKTFFPGWDEAALAFVPAGKTLNGMDPDSDPDIIHADTGFGKFDHHQTNADICAAKLIYAEIKDKRGFDPALERMVEFVNDIDHFREVYFPNPAADFWDFSLVSQIDGWRLLYSESPLKIATLGMDSLDAIYKTFQNKIWAEKEIKNAIEFDSPWGKGLGLTTVNDEVVHLGQKKGYVIVVRKDPHKGYLRIKAFPKPEIDLEPFFLKFQKADPDASWFLHASHHMILNGSSKNPDMKPSKLLIEDVIAILKK